MSSTKFAYKELPKFTPPFYRQWASVVKDAFAERDWNDYLITPESRQTITDPSTSKTDESTPFIADPSISARAKAFLSQSIDFKYQPSIESCTSAAEIWTAADNNSGGLATGMGVHDVDTFDGVEHLRGIILNTWFCKAHERAIRHWRGSVHIIYIVAKSGNGKGNSA